MYLFSFFFAIIHFPFANLLHLPIEVDIVKESGKVPKLLILALDGFRWDYYEQNKQSLPYLKKFLSEGVQTRFVEPIFPSLTYPSWTTILTGLYPSSHNVIGNYMLHLADENYPEAVFQLTESNSNDLPVWWDAAADTLWITALKAGRKVYMANFPHCNILKDVPTLECEGFQFQRVNTNFRGHLSKALDRFRDGFSLAMIYDDFIDYVGHEHGPDSKEVRLALLRFDTILQHYLTLERYYGLEDEINVVIVSDHGMTTMTTASGVKYVKLEDYISDKDQIYKVIDYGVVVAIAATPGKAESLYIELTKMPGVKVFQKEDIPEEFHYKGSKFVHDILLVAENGYAIVGLEGDKQIPSDAYSSAVEPFPGSHGYYKMTDMRTIFYAKGPAFKRGIVLPKINLVDEYQIFTKVLEIEPCPHNGTFENVANMFT